MLCIRKSCMTYIYFFHFGNSEIRGQNEGLKSLTFNFKVKKLRIRPEKIHNDAPHHQLSYDTKFVKISQFSAWKNYFMLNGF